MSYEPRIYRQLSAPEDLVCFEVALGETDLQVCAETDLADRAEDLIVRARWELDQFIGRHPRFGETFSPYDVPESAPHIAQRMSRASRLAGVGPMAAVAGAIAEYVARGLAEFSAEVIVENGGDLYFVGSSDRTVALWTGHEHLRSVGLLVRGGLQPVAVCTSSGTVGHSTSFGSADAVTVIARDGALADAVATGLANRVRGAADIERAIEAAKGVTGVLGVLVAVEQQIGAWGNIRLVPLETTTIT